MSKRQVNLNKSVQKPKSITLDIDLRYPEQKKKYLKILKQKRDFLKERLH